MCLLAPCRNFRWNGDANQAAAIAFYAILSAIPLFILTVVTAKFFFGSHPNIQQEVANKIQEFHPYLTEKFLSQSGMQTSGAVGSAG